MMNSDFYLDSEISKYFHFVFVQEVMLGIAIVSGFHKYITVWLSAAKLIK